VHKVQSPLILNPWRWDR